MELLDQLCREMIAYDKGDPRRIHHFLKVHAFAEQIGREEGIPEKQLFVLEAAAYVHDIGIHLCEEKYGNCNGKLQEKEGPALAEAMLRELGFAQAVISRVSFLVGHHHTYTHIYGIDYQLLVEADFLVNIYEDGFTDEMIENVRNKIFKTHSGIRCLENMYLRNR